MWKGVRRRLGIGTKRKRIAAAHVVPTFALYAPLSRRLYTSYSEIRNSEHEEGILLCLHKLLLWPTCHSWNLSLRSVEMTKPVALGLPVLIVRVMQKAVISYEQLQRDIDSFQRETFTGRLVGKKGEIHAFDLALWQELCVGRLSCARCPC